MSRLKLNVCLQNNEQTDLDLTLKTYQGSSEALSEFTSFILLLNYVSVTKTNEPKLCY